MNHSVSLNIMIIKYLNAIQTDDADPKPRVQAVEIGNGALIMIFEGSVNTDDSKYQCNAMENKMNQLLHFLLQRQ